MIRFISALKSEQPNIEKSLTLLSESIPLSLREIVRYSLLAGGKRLRPFFTVITAKLFGRNDDGIYPLSALPEFVHTASLLHDDIIDKADYRRGKPASHLKFGTTLSILAGDAMLALVNQCAAEYNSPSIMKEISEAVLMTASGEAEEIALQHSVEHGMDKYLDIIKGKTAYLIKCSCTLGAIYAQATIEHIQSISNFGFNLGIAFQIVDDCLDFSEEAITGKPEAGDLLEGKFTPPIILYAEGLSEENRREFYHKFRNSSFTSKEIHDIALAVRRQGLAEKSKKLAEEFLTNAENSLSLLPFSKSDLKIFRQAADFVRKRTH